MVREKSRFILAGLLVLSFTGCKPRSWNDDARPQTDLGEKGNERVARAYRAYRTEREEGRLSGCSAVTSGARRVLLHGFGPFDGVEHNISGYVAEGLSRADFFKSGMRLADMVLPGELPELNEKPGAYAARATQRSLEYEGKKYEICVVRTAVQWDLAAALVLFEAQRFRPQMVILSGRSATADRLIVEKDATYKAAFSAGYDKEGRQDADNTPVDAPILPPANGVEEVIRSTWDAEKLVSGLRPALEKWNQLAGAAAGMNVQPQLHPAPQWSNDYICNNTTYLVLHGLKGVPLPLAGGTLTLRPTAIANSSAGFLHYPLNSQTTPAHAWLWGHVVMQMVAANFD